MTTTKKTKITPSTTKNKVSEGNDDLIPLSAYVDDIKSRMEINNREVSSLIKDLRVVVEVHNKLIKQAIEVATPVVTKLVESVRTKLDELRSESDPNTVD